jgi:hypothetical protein
VSPRTSFEQQIEPAVLTRLSEHAQRVGKSINDLLTDILDEQELLGQNREAPPSPSQTTVQEWSRALRAWAQSHPHRSTPADDSRAEIYKGRGE